MSILTTLYLNTCLYTPDYIWILSWSLIMDSSSYLHKESLSQNWNTKTVQAEWPLSSSLGPPPTHTHTQSGTHACTHFQGTTHVRIGETIGVRLQEDWDSTGSYNGESAEAKWGRDVKDVTRQKKQHCSHQLPSGRLGKVEKNVTKGNFFLPVLSYIDRLTYYHVIQSILTSTPPYFCHLQTSG